MGFKKINSFTIVLAPRCAPVFLLHNVIKRRIIWLLIVHLLSAHLAALADAELYVLLRQAVAQQFALSVAHSAGLVQQSHYSPDQVSGYMTLDWRQRQVCYDAAVIIARSL